MSDPHSESSCKPILPDGDVDRFRVDELLEILYYVEEESIAADEADLVRRLTEHDPEPAKVVDAARHAGLFEIRGGAASLTDVGRTRAVGIIRRHRLAEILFSQVLEVPETEVEPSACEMEHILSTGVTDSVCAFLGHPPRCPHGRPIPQGECCKTYTAKVAPLVVPLAELELGRSAPIVFISSRTAGRLTRLADLGVLPGAQARLRQRQPSYVVEIGAPTLALEREIAREIYARREAPAA